MRNALTQVPVSIQTVEHLSVLIEQPVLIKEQTHKRQAHTQRHENQQGLHETARRRVHVTASKMRHRTVERNTRNHRHHRRNRQGNTGVLALVQRRHNLGQDAHTKHGNRRRP